MSKNILTFVTITNKGKADRNICSLSAEVLKCRQVSFPKDRKPSGFRIGFISAQVKIFVFSPVEEQFG